MYSDYFELVVWTYENIHNYQKRTESPMNHYHTSITGIKTEKKNDYAH